MNQPRVVIDTNVLLSALLFNQGSVAWLRHAWQLDAIRPLTGRKTTEELLRVLAYPRFKLTAADYEDLLGDYLPWCETVSVLIKTKVPDCRDPFDRPFLALALAAKADALVTGDKNLLALADGFKVPILTPTTFKQHFTETTKNEGTDPGGITESGV